MLLKVEKSRTITESNKDFDYQLDVEKLFVKLTSIKNETEQKVICFLADAKSPFAGMEKEVKLAQIANYLEIDKGRVSKVYAYCLQDTPHRDAFREYSSRQSTLAMLLSTSTFLIETLCNSMNTIDLEDLSDKDDKQFDRLIKFYERLEVMQSSHEKLETKTLTVYDRELLQIVMENQNSSSTTLINKAEELQKKKNLQEIK